MDKFSFRRELRRIRIEIARAVFKIPISFYWMNRLLGSIVEMSWLSKDLINSFNDKIIIVVTHSTSPDFLDSFDELIHLDALPSKQTIPLFACLYESSLNLLEKNWT